MKTKELERILIKGVLSERFDEHNILGIYNYGSVLYGTDNEKSDLDYCIVVKDYALVYCDGYTQIETEDLDLHIMFKSHYERLLKEHDIMALEMYYQKEPIMKCEVDFELDLQVLRRSISTKVNNSWVKARKKIELVNEDSHIGMKSLYHSFRILDFGIQIAKYGKIEDYNFVGGLNLVRDNDLDKIRNPNWDYWNEKLKKKHNAKMSEFRILAPK